MKKEYPSRLFHKTPSWVKDGAVFHIRIRCAVDNEVVLSCPDVAPALLESAEFYTQKQRWFLHLFVLMPDHIHALISFPREQVMSRVVADWKRYHSRELGIQWQDNFFDHRIRNAAEFQEKAAYIRNNPVVKGVVRDAAGMALAGGTRRSGAVRCRKSVPGRAAPPEGKRWNATSGRGEMLKKRPEDRPLHLRKKGGTRPPGAFSVERGFDRCSGEFRLSV